MPKVTEKKIATPAKQTLASEKGKPKKMNATVASSTPGPKTSNADAKGRVVLGPKYANKLFRVSEQPDGNLLLEPVVTVHEREAWLFQNPEALAMVMKGIAESKSGNTVYRGSFAQYLEIDTEEDDENGA